MKTCCYCYDDCNQLEGRGLCKQCYQRLKRWGLLSQFPPGTKGRAAKWLSDFLAKLPTTDACILWPFGKAQGYASMTVNGRLCQVARLVLEHVTGRPLPADMEAIHDCTIRACINPRHLIEGTRQDTMALCARKDRKGNKLTNADVRNIRALYPGLRQREIAEQFGISIQAVSDIITGDRRRYAA